MEKRRQAMDEQRANRQKALDAAPPVEGDDVLDNLLEKLRNGDTVGRRARRARPSAENRGVVPLTLTLNGTTPSDDTVDIARDMLARLQSDGFVAPPTPTTSVAQRRRRRRTEKALGTDKDLPGSPLAAEIHDIHDDSASESQTSESQEALDTLTASSTP